MTLSYSHAHQQGSGTTAALTSVSIECPPMFVVGGNLGCSFKTDGMYDSHEWTGTFSTDGSQIDNIVLNFEEEVVIEAVLLSDGCGCPIDVNMTMM